MAISPRNRKRLWTRAGNLCALCKCSLVERRKADDNDVIIADEAHIVSSKQNGPRYRELPLEYLDSYENLILLCRNDHRRIDDDRIFFTEARVVETKRRHEQWVEQALAAATGGKSLPKAFEDSVLHRLLTGTAVTTLMQSTLANSWGWTPLETADHAELIGEFADFVNDLSDVLPSSSVSTQTKAEIILNGWIKKLAAAGLFLYGRRLVQRLETPFGSEELMTSVFRITRVDHTVFIDLGLVPRSLLLA